ncbi:MAG TPA: site-2 protease family protein [Roseiflexaceae bacterium]|nr:site-2 protease family protein [Roseiflexaceae bacterium]
MRDLYHIITVRRTPVRLHYSWLIAALIGLPLLTTVILPAALPDSSVPGRLLLALLILATYVGVVIVHELAHLLVARLMHIRFPVMNLYPLGALTRLPARFGSPKAAFWSAAAGPTASIALAWLLSTLAKTAGISQWLAVVLSVGGQLSFYLGLINLLPGLPLDGGHMLRAALQLVTGSFETATRIARVAGQLVAYGLVFIGASRLIGAQDWLFGGALLLVGWAIREAGGTAYRRALVAQLLNQLKAADVLSRPRRTIGPERNLRDFSVMLRGRMGNEPTPVIANGAFVGLIDRNTLRAVPQGYWDERTVAEAMLPAANLIVVTPTTPVSALIPHLASDAIIQQPNMMVVQDAELHGMIDADELVALLELEEEFGLFARGPIAQQQNITSPTSEAVGREGAAGKHTTRQYPVGQ